MKYFFPCVKL